VDEELVAPVEPSAGEITQPEAGPGRQVSSSRIARLTMKVGACEDWFDCELNVKLRLG